MIFQTHTCHFHSYLLKESLKSEGIGMHRNKNKGLHDVHGNYLIEPQLGHAETKVGNPHSPQYTVS
jgi:hypothetical protein